MSKTPPDHAGVIAPPPLIYAVGLLLGLLLDRAMPLPALPERVARIGGAALALLGLPLAFPAMAALLRARTALLPDHATTTILTGGPFRYTRNPIYLGMTLIYTGAALLRNTAWPLLLLPAVLAVMTRGVIEREERYLEQKFGAQYTRYKARVRRWL